jgi:hypothetical protein
MMAMNPFPSESNLLADILGPAGYTTAFSISAAELAFLREAIFAQWIERIEALHPELVPQFRAAGLEHYHRLSHLVSHETLWPKECRVLPKATASDVSGFEFVQRLASAFERHCRISDVVFFSNSVPGYPEIYWRLVRPGVASDVGAMHTDRWFHDILGETDTSSLFGDDETTIKMWLPIYTEPGLNGLYVVPGSHRKQWRVKYTEARDGFRRPSLDEPLEEDARHLVPVVAGQAILFNENLLHGGALNGGKTSRVSVEITFVIKRTGLPQ